LLLRDSEGVLRRYRTRSEDVDLVVHAAHAATVRVEVAPPSAAPSDGLAARWAGLPTVLLSSAADGGYPHYHRPSDVPENVNIETVVAARRLCTQLVAELDRDSGQQPPARADETSA
jgi:Iap family predicted aminopeptidase